MTGLRVEVYRNLRRGGFSVRHGNRVIDRVGPHLDELWLTDATFVVRPGGHAAYLRTGARNVHAFVRGTVSGPTHGTLYGFERVAYDLPEGVFRWVSDWEVVVGPSEAVLFRGAGCRVPGRSRGDGGLGRRWEVWVLRRWIASDAGSAGPSRGVPEVRRGPEGAVTTYRGMPPRGCALPVVLRQVDGADAGHLDPGRASEVLGRPAPGVALDWGYRGEGPGRQIGPAGGEPDDGHGQGHGRPAEARLLLGRERDVPGGGGRPDGGSGR